MTDSPAQPDGQGENPKAPMSFDPTGDLLKARILDAPSRPGLMGSLDHYEILEIVGVGGMGIVFRARDSTTSAEVAIKVLKPELVSQPKSVHRFLVEARHMHRMSHPGILRVQVVSDRSNGPYYVMPYMQRGSLVRLLRPSRPLEPELTLSIARQIAEALEYAHGRGIIHRDIKPGNVLLDAEGRAYLTDFGLVRTVYNDSIIDVESSQCIGTAPYMSPAVAAGQAEDTRCDIYSFGALMYEMLTGEPPYEGRSRDQVIRRILAGPPLPILQRNPQAPKGMVKIAEGAMARELRDRYAQMSDVVADLERVALGQDPLGPHGRRKSRRKPPLIRAVAALTGLVVITAAILLIVRSWKGSHEPAPPAQPEKTTEVKTKHIAKPLAPERRITFNLSYLSAPAPAHAADIADLNGDGILDIVCGYSKDPKQPQENYVYWGADKRRFRLEKGFGRGAGVFGMKIADLTGDKRPDVLMLRVLEEFPSLLFENTSDGFRQREANLAKSDHWGGNGCQGLAVGDLDGDGDLDAVSGHRGDYGPYISINDGKGNFTRTRLNDWGAHDDIELADMDGDGDLDIIDSGPVDGWAGHSAIYWNAGDGTFPQRTLFHNVPGHFGVSVADIDGDGDMDIALGIGHPDPAVIYRNEGNRKFLLHASFKPHFNVVLADLDGNGTPELITSGVEGDKGIDGKCVHIYWDCKPDGLVDKYGAPGWPDAICGRTINVADLDADGVPDIFVDGQKKGNFILWGKASALAN